jgi:hypothetical protein
VVAPRAEIGPRGALLLLSGMEAAQRWWRADGKAPPAGWAEVYEVLAGVALAAGGRPMPVRNAPPVETAVSYADPIGATQAAFLLGITPRGVRDLCTRGVLETARRRPGGWVMERSEVEARAAVQAVSRPAVAAPADAGSAAVPLVAGEGRLAGITSLVMLLGNSA